MVVQSHSCVWALKITWICQKTILVVRAKVTKADRANLDADKKVGVVDNFLHSLFKQVDVFLKEKQVTSAMGTYGYRMYFETLLNYSPTANQLQLAADAPTATRFETLNK